MATLEINGRRVEVDDSFRSLSPEQQQATVEEIAGSIGAPQKGLMSRVGDSFRGMVNDLVIGNGPHGLQFNTAAEGMLNDIGGGLQGVNPVAMQEAQPIGIMGNVPGMVSLLDGTTRPASEFPADQFATMQRGGQTYIVPRTATDSAGKPVEEGRLASMGRLLGYGVATGVPGRAVPPRPDPSQELAQAAEASGVTPSFAMQGPTSARIAAAGEQFFPTSGRFRGDAERVTGEIASAASRLADRAGPGATPVEAGEALQRGGETYVSGVRNYQGALYDAVDKIIAPKTRIATPETATYLRRELAKFSGTPNIGKSAGTGELAGWLDDISGGKPAPAPKAAAMPKRPQTVLEALQDIGVNDDAQGDLIAMGVRDWDKRNVGRKNVLRTDGKTPDIAARILWERGFLRDDELTAAMRKAELGEAPEPNLVEALHRAIDDELGGEPHFAEMDFAAGQAWREAAENPDDFAAAMRPVAEAIDNGATEGLTWEAARALRTDVGEALGKMPSGPATSVSRGRLKQVYAALSKDLDAAAENLGPAASHAWKRANTFKRVSEERIERAFGKVLGDKVTPEAAYDRLVAMTAAGGSRANISGLSQVFRTLPKEDAAVVAGTIIRRLGRADAAQGETFSAAKFLSGWNKMSPAARSIIGRGGLDEGVADGLTRLANVIDRFQAAEAVRNRSNTGNVATAAAFGASAMAAPLTTAAVGAVSHLSARAVTNPEFLRAVTAYVAKGEAGGLLRIARSNSPLAIEAAQTLRLSAPSSQQSQPTAP